MRVPLRTHLAKTTSTAQDGTQLLTAWCGLTGPADTAITGADMQPAPPCPDCAAAYTFATGSEHPRSTTYRTAGPTLTAQREPRRQPQQLGVNIRPSPRRRRPGPPTRDHSP